MDYGVCDVLVVSADSLRIQRISEVSGRLEPLRICWVKTNNGAIRALEDLVSTDRNRSLGVIVTETRSPELDEYIMARQAHVPVILTQGGGDSKHPDSAVINTGASDYLPNIGYRQEFVSKVQEALAKRA